MFHGTLNVSRRHKPLGHQQITDLHETAPNIKMSCVLDREVSRRT
jgi:hypothetical protein